MSRTGEHRLRCGIFGNLWPAEISGPSSLAKWDPDDGLSSHELRANIQTVNMEKLPLHHHHMLIRILIMKNMDLNS